MRPVLWRHRLTGLALFTAAVWVTSLPSGAILASGWSAQRPLEPIFAEVAQEEPFGIELAWEPITLPTDPAPEPVPLPVAAPGEEASEPQAGRSRAPAYSADPADGPTPTVRAQARDALVAGGPRAAAAPSAKGDKKCLEPDSRIRDLGGGRYEVDRGLAESYADLDRLRTLGFVVPHRDDQGRAEGYRIGGIRCGNALHQSGLRRGDVVTAVNGRATRTGLQIMSAWLAERDSDVLRLEILRGGKRKTLVYRLV